MMKTLQILIFISSVFPAFGQKIYCSEFTEYEWILYSSSAGDPFITSDTVVIMLDINSTNEEITKYSENYEWDVVFDSDGTIELINIDYKKAARSKDGPFYTTKYLSTLKWSCDSKILNIIFEDKIIKYSIGKLKNNLLTLIKHQ